MIVKDGYLKKMYLYSFEAGFTVANEDHTGEYRLLPECALLDVYRISPGDWISKFGFVDHITTEPVIYRYEPARDYRSLSFNAEGYYPPMGWDSCIPSNIQEPFVLRGISMEQRLALLQQHVEFALVDLGWEVTDELVLALWGYEVLNTAESSN